MKEAGTPRIIDATNWRLDSQVGSSEDHFHFVLSAGPSSPANPRTLLSSTQTICSHSSPQV